MAFSTFNTELLGFLSGVMKRGIRDGDGSSKEGMKIDKKRMHIMLKQSRAGPPLIASVTLPGGHQTSGL